MTLITMTWRLMAVMYVWHMLVLACIHNLLVGSRNSYHGHQESLVL